RYRAVFETTYMPGSIEAVSYKDGKEISRTQLKTVGAPARVSLYPERMEIASGGESLCYVKVAVEDADGNHVPDAAIKLQAEVTGAAELAGFGSANPVTEENYTTGIFTTFNGLAQAVLRSGTAAGKAELKVSSELGESTVTIDVI
ncbi:MAG: glycoside hydrolase family 2 protein, partial [Clostridiales bacterium]|nr:glycoside hydrolase family 2 protein [Clostridiales bacterium]